MKERLREHGSLNGPRQSSVARKHRSEFRAIEFLRRHAELCGHFIGFGHQVWCRPCGGGGDRGVECIVHLQCKLTFLQRSPQKNGILDIIGLCGSSSQEVR